MPQQFTKIIDALKAKGFYALYAGDEKYILPHSDAASLLKLVSSGPDTKIAFSDVNDSEVGSIVFHYQVGDISLGKIEGKDGFKNAVFEGV